MTGYRVALRDGRNLGVTATGDPAATRIVLMCLPSPGASGFDPDPEITGRWGVRLMSLDRPGSGASDAPATGLDARVGTRADEFAQYVDRVEEDSRATQGVDFGPIGVVGWGYGALDALALAVHRPEMVGALALVDPLSPEAVSDEPPQPPFTLGDLGIPDDAAELDRPGLRDRLERMLEAAAAQGDAGVRADRAALPGRHAPGPSRRLDVAPLVLTSPARLAATRRALADLGASSGFARLEPEVVGGASDGLAIVAGWERILRHVAPAHGDVPASARR